MEQSETGTPFTSNLIPLGQMLNILAELLGVEGDGSNREHDGTLGLGERLDVEHDVV